MNSRRILALVIASLLLTASAAWAVTDTWDGGGANDNLNNGLNWVDNSAPLSDLANTDLIFAGVAGLAPNVTVAFSTRSITFNNTAGAFTIGGLQLNVGVGGITNDDTQTMTFDNLVNFSGVANATIDAAAGGLTFTSGVILPTSTLTVDGTDPTSFVNIAGTGALKKGGAGTMTWTPNVATGFDVTVSAGTLTMGADGTTDLFNSTSTIAISGTSDLNINESLTLDGAQLTQADSASVDLAAGKTLTVQDGGDVAITGSFSHDTASTIAVTVAGSTFATTSTLSLIGGSTTNVSAGGSVSAGSGTVSVGTNGHGTATVAGTGSSLSGGTLSVGLNGATGTLAFSSDSTGTFSGIGVDASGVAGTSGTFNIQSSAEVTGTSLAIATGAVANDGTVTITGAGSTLTLNGTGAANIGAASASTGTLNVNASGVFNSGTGLTTVHPTGTIAIGGGTYNSRGNLTINGGQLTRSSTGALAFDAGTTFTVQAGGDATITGAYFNLNPIGLVVTGAGSKFSSSQAMFLDHGIVANVLAGGTVASAVGIAVGTLSDGSVTVDGVGSAFTGGIIQIGFGAGDGDVTLRNASTGIFTAIDVANDSSAGTTSAALRVESGATLTGTSLALAPREATKTGTVVVTGAGSVFTLSGAATAAIGAASASVGTLSVQSNGTFNTGTGLTTVNATGAIAIAGGTFNANGSVTLNGGQLTRGATGLFDLDAGRALTVQGGGDAIFTGLFTHNDGTITITGAGSTFSTTSTLELIGGTATNVLAGGSLSAGSGALLVGTNGAGTVTVSGAGSSFGGGELRLGSATVTFSGASAGNFAQIRVGQDGATTAALNIQSGSGVTGTGLLVGVDNPGTVTITGAGSTLLLPGSAAAQIGSGTDHGTLNVNDSGTFESSTGLTTVMATSTIAIGGGTFHAHGNLTLNGGQLIRSAGALILDPGTTLTVQAGGDAIFDLNYTNATASTIAVTGAGSTLSTTSILELGGGSALNITADGDVTSGSFVAIGRVSDATATVDGAGSTLAGTQLQLGGNGHSGSATFRNNSAGTFTSSISLVASAAGVSSGTLTIESGADVAGATLRLAAIAGANTGTITVTGANSTLVLNDPASANLIGSASATTAALNIQSGGAVTTTNSSTTIRATGTVAITGGTFTSNNNLTIDGGQLTRDAAGIFNLGNGRTLTVQGGGDANFTGDYVTPDSATFTVTGALSRINATNLTIRGGSTATASAGGRLSAFAVNVGTAGGNGTVTIDGAGSSIGASNLFVGQGGSTGTFTFDHGCTGLFTTINVDATAAATAGTVGLLTIQGGSSVNAANLNVANGSTANSGSVTVTGAASALALTGAATIGAASATTGTVTVQSGGTFTTGTGAVNVALTGALNVQAGATLRGAADYAGAGPITLAGSFLPGTATGADRTTSVSFAQNLTLQPTTSITLELAGLVAGTSHDQLVFNGPGTPHITWNGALNVVTIPGFVPQAGHSFDLLNFDAARDAGAFTSINLPALTAGLFWRTERLDIDGTLSVATAPGTYAEWQSFYGTGAWDADDDGDGIENGIEFLLGTDPNVAFAPGQYPIEELPRIGNTARVTFDIPALPASDALYAVESSPDLVTWTPIATKDGSAPWVSIAGVTFTEDPPVAGYVKVIVSETLPAATARRFHRLLGEEP